MKKAVGILLAFILMFNVSLGYTLTVNTIRGTTTREIDSERMVTVGLSDRSPANYVVNTANAILKVFGNRRQFVMPEENVEITINGDNTEPGDGTYTLSCNTNGGNKVASQTVTLGSAYGDLPVPNRPGYTFGGWYLDSNCTTSQIISTTIVQTANNHTLYAKWSPVLRVGDYVEYHPLGSEINLTALTGITQNPFDPRLTTTWRVLSNDGVNVELVSEDVVGILALAEGSSEIGKVLQARNNYANLVYIFNQISEGYETPGIFLCVENSNGYGTDEDPSTGLNNLIRPVVILDSDVSLESVGTDGKHWRVGEKVKYKPEMPNLLDAYDTGSSMTDNVTKFYEDLVIEGQVYLANAAVKIYKDGEYYPQTTSNSSGYWTATIDNEPNVWTHYTVTVLDESGNESDMSEALRIYSDTIVPILTVPEVEYDAFALDYNLANYTTSPIEQIGTTAADPRIVFNNTSEYGTIK